VELAAAEPGGGPCVFCMFHVEHIVRFLRDARPLAEESRAAFYEGFYAFPYERGFFYCPCDDGGVFCDIHWCARREVVGKEGDPVAEAQRPDSIFKETAFAFASVRSLMAATSKLLSSIRSLNTLRPMRPNPLIPTFVAIIKILSFCAKRYSICSGKSPDCKHSQKLLNKPKILFRRASKHVAGMAETSYVSKAQAQPARQNFPKTFNPDILRKHG